MANLTGNVAMIRQAVLGKEVREALASGIEVINYETTQIGSKQNILAEDQEALETQFNTVLENSTSAAPNNEELVAGHTSLITGENFGTIGKRMDSHESELANMAKQKLIADINGTEYTTGKTLDYAWLRNQQSVLYSQFYRNLIKGVFVKICCMGDSLTYGHDTTSTDKRVADPVPCADGTTHTQTRASITYPEALQEYLRSIYGDDKVNVINRGHSADYVANGYTHWYTQHDSNLTILMFGTNDARAGYVPVDIRGDIKVYIDWYEQLIIREIVWGKAVIILTPPKLRTANSLDIHSYKLALKTMADKYGVPVVDSTEFTANYPSTIFSDDTHYNATGYRVIASKISALFIGNGLQNPYMVSDGDIMLTRNTLDSVRFFGNTALHLTIGSTSPDEVNSTTGLTAMFNNSGSGLIYSFYTETDDLMILPFFYSNAYDCKVTLDFNTTSPRNSNDFMVDMSTTIGEILPKQVTYNLSMLSPILTDLIKPTNDIAQPILIRIAEKGWHTVKIETNVTGTIIFNSIAFMSYRNYKQQRDILQLNLQSQLNTFKKGYYKLLTHGSSDSTLVITSNIIPIDDIISALSIDSFTQFWRGIPLKITVFNYDQSILEYILVYTDSNTSTVGWNFIATPIRNNLITTPNAERIITSVAYNSSLKQITLNYAGATNRPTSIIISVL